VSAAPTQRRHSREGGNPVVLLNRLRRSIPSVVPACFWRGPRVLCRLRRRSNSYGAVRAPPARYFSLARPREKYRKEVWPKRASQRGPDIRTSLYIKAARSRLTSLRFSPRPGASRARRRLNHAARARHRLATTPGRGSDARRRLRGPTSKATATSGAIRCAHCALPRLVYYA
jgi:hypothetical protein